MNFKVSQDNLRLRWPCFLQIVLLILMVYGNGNGRVTNADWSADEYHNLRWYLGKLCRSIDSMRQMSDMRAMIATIKAIGKLPPHNDDSGQIPQPPSPNDNNNHGVFVSWTDYWNLSQDPARPCLENAPAILDLGPIIDEKNNVCKPSHIDLIEAYKKKYLDITTRPNNHNNRITKRFFNLYSNQVSFICKRNLINSLQLADEKLSMKYAKVMPWLSEPLRECPVNVAHDDTDIVYKHNNNNDNTESIHGEASGSPDRFQAGRLISNSLIYDNGETDSRALRCKAIEALSNVKNINELVEVMEKDSSGQDDDHEHQSGQADGDSVSVKNRVGRVSNLMLVIPDGDMRETVEQMLEACSQFKQIYSHTIIPIVRLIQMGFNPTYKKFDERCQADILPQRWFSITLICHAMLRSRLADQKSQSDFKDDLVDSGTGLIVVEDQIIQDKDDPISKTTTTNEPQQQSGNELVVFKNPIEDELWVGKYLPSRFKRLRTRYISNLLEVFKIDKLRNSVVFKKNVKRGRSIIVTLLFVGLTLIGINSSPNLLQ